MTLDFIFNNLWLVLVLTVLVFSRFDELSVTVFDALLSLFGGALVPQFLDIVVQI